MISTATTLLRRVAYLSICMLMGWTLQAAAQGTIEGTVTEQGTGDPLPGVNVAIPDLNVGAATGLDGTFQITDVPAGEYTLQARFVGFQTRQRTVEVEDGETVTVNIGLRESTMEMDEVVVTGTGGNARRREIGNSITQVSAADIEATANANFSDVLQGRAAGVSIIENSGQVGAGSSIRLRGNNSVSQGNTPLIYIDGVRVDNGNVAGDPETNQGVNPFDDINPQDIQSIEVIKGPAATTLYGTEASGGVIQIFTKQGAQGAPQFDFTVRQGINHMNRLGTQDFHEELGPNSCSDEPGCPSGGDWLRAGHTQSYNLSVRGGNEDLTYFASGRWSSEDGVIAPQGSDGYAIRGNFGFTPTDDIRIQFNNSYTYRDITWIPDGNNAEGFLLNSLRGEAGYTPDGNDALVFDMNLGTATNHFTSGITFNWTPLTSLNQTVNLGLDYVNSEYTEERPFGFFYDPLGDRENDTDTRRRLTLDYNGTYSTDLTDAISSSTTWGGQLFKDEFINLNGFGYEFAGPGDKVLDSGARTESFESRVSETSGGFFAQQRFGWNDQVFVTVGLRVDGNSTFGEDFGLAPYPKVSASYLISDHGFFPEWWETMKLRAAFGESGQAPGPFASLRTYESVSGDEGQPGVTPAQVGASDLGPERSREYEGGFDMALFDGRVSGTFTAYYQKTYDALLSVQPTPSNGFTDTQLRNVGTFRNQGIELDLGVDVLRRDNVEWNVGGYFSTSNSEALDLGDAGPAIQLSWRNEVREGGPIPGFYQDVVVNPDQIPDDPTSVEFTDDTFIGPVYPTRSLGVNTSVTLYDVVTLDVVGEGQFGHVLSSGTAYQNTRRRAWPQCTAIQEQIDDGGNFAGLTAGQIGLCDPNQTTYGMWTKGADFFKIRSASLSFRLPQSWLPSGLRNGTLRLQGRNLFTATDYPGLDPEAYEDGNRPGALYRQEYYNMPPIRSFTFSMQAGF